MTLKKFFYLGLLAVMIFSFPTKIFAETSATEKLVQIERDTYGKEETGALLNRISKLEKDFNGQNQKGNMNARIEAIFDSLYENTGEPGIIAKINALEWNINHEVKNDSIETRLSALEENLLGKKQEGSFSARIRELSNVTFGNEDIPMIQMQLPADTLIKVALIDSINSKNLRVGDIVHIKVVEDVTADGNLVFAKGLLGEGTVKSVRKAKGWTGTNGKVEIDFNKIRMIDGRSIETYVGEKSKTEMESKQMVEGASLVAMNLNDKLNKILVRGKNVEITSGAELYVQTKNSAAVYVLSGE